MKLTGRRGPSSPFLLPLLAAVVGVFGARRMLPTAEQKLVPLRESKAAIAQSIKTMNGMSGPEIDRLRREAAARRQTISTAEGAMPTKVDPGLLLRRLDALARANNLTLGAFGPDAKVAEHLAVAPYALQGYTTSARGQWGDIVSMLRLWSAQEPASVMTARSVKREEGGALTVDLAIGLLSKPDQTTPRAASAPLAPSGRRMQGVPAVPPGAGGPAMRPVPNLPGAPMPGGPMPPPR